MSDHFESLIYCIGMISGYGKRGGKNSDISNKGL